MNAPDFSPKDGFQPQWRYAYDLVVSKEIGDDITLMELGEEIGIDHFSAEGRNQLRGIMTQAVKHLERDKQHTVRTIYKYGWRVMSPQENLEEVGERRMKAARTVDRAARLLNATDRNLLSPNDRQRYDAEQRSVIAAESLFNRRPASFMELHRLVKERRQLPQQPA